MSLRAVGLSSGLVEAACQEVRREGDSGLDRLIAQFDRGLRQTVRRRR